MLWRGAAAAGGLAVKQLLLVELEGVLLAERACCT